VSGSSEGKKKKLWTVYEDIFRPAKVRTSLQRFADMLRSVGKIVLLALLFIYPILMVYAGIVYGAVAFWSSLFGSVLVIGIVLSRTGYARNFEGRRGSLGRGLASLFLAFVAIVGLYLGLFHFGFFIVPIFLGVVATAAIVAVVMARF